MKITVIGPFFRRFSHGADQRGFMQALATALGEDGNEVWCAAVHDEPLKPDAPFRIRREVFEYDLHMLDVCEAVVAVLDDFDSGTMFEMGYAHCAGKPVIGCFCVMPETLNVMVAEGAVAFCEGIEQAVSRVRMLKEGTLSRAAWTGKVF
ncbi:MAG: nucleoside 2-deoxyribosyltransferase [Methermicoccaceae archaeon]